jgi:hypothetical protein
MKKLLEAIIYALVDNKDQVVIDEQEDEDGNVILKISAAESDLGKIIGKSGNTITAVRKIIKAYAMKLKKKVTVEVL